ncbi:hypothetical protein D3C84_508710 [compost metagenome]
MLAIFAVADPHSICAFGLFAITVAAGRICSGYTCPQRMAKANGPRKAGRWSAGIDQNIARITK